MRKHSALVCVLLLAIAIVLSCAGCGNSQNGDKDSQKAATENVFDEPLTFICTSASGGDTDFNSRLIAKYLEEASGQTIVCNNVNGGNGSVALTQYKDMEPDNSTFILTNSSVLSGNYATGLMDFAYDAYDPVAIYGVSSGEVILVPQDSPYQSLSELVEASQRNPNSVVYGGPIGGASYLACYLVLAEKYNAQMSFVEAGDGAERLASLLGGQLDVCNSALLNCRDYIESGELRPLATLLSSAPSAYPDIPVASEEFPSMVQDTYYVILALKGTSPDVIEQLNAAVMDIVENNESFRQEYYQMNMQDARAMSVLDTIQTLEQQKIHFTELAEMMGGSEGK